MISNTVMVAMHGCKTETFCENNKKVASRIKLRRLGKEEVRRQ